MSNGFDVQSYQGKYQVSFVDGEVSLDEDILQHSHIIIDNVLLTLYAEQLKPILSKALSVLAIDAEEKNKSLEQMPCYVSHLVKNKLRRNQRLIAIGGGITQDITCFLAANMLRGVEWWFIPTTLLAQADSCIGSKSSINCGDSKNILGTFTPPKRVLIHLAFLKTLTREAIHSGIGEMLKVHAIHGEASFHLIAQDYPKLFADDQLMTHYIRRSLEIKKTIIEQDEFDKGVRQVMNYGHSFGHAIESATNYVVPHGIAVTIGMDMANYVAMQFKLTSYYHFRRMHEVFYCNYMDYAQEPIDLEAFISAISKDKKNIGNEMLGLILPNEHGAIVKTLMPLDLVFAEHCDNFLKKHRCLLENSALVSEC